MKPWPTWPTIAHRLLFTWGIAHLDVEGRITGSPRGFKALVAPLLDHITHETVLSFFQDAESLGLIQRYEVDGEWHVQYPKFAHNQNLTKSREAASKRPTISSIQTVLIFSWRANWMTEASPRSREFFRKGGNDQGLLAFEKPVSLLEFRSSETPWSIVQHFLADFQRDQDPLV